MNLSLERAIRDTLAFSYVPDTVNPHPGLSPVRLRPCRAHQKQSSRPNGRELYHHPLTCKTRQVHTAKGRSPGFRIKACLLHLSSFPFPFPLRLGNSGFGCSSPVTVAGPRRNYTCLPYSPLKTAPLATILFILLYYFLLPRARTTIIIFFSPKKIAGDNY